MAAESNAPWYSDGLRFECTQCGKCCTGAPGYVWLNDEEVDALATRVDVSREVFLREYTRREGGRRTLIEKPNNDCVFYEKGVGCTVYEQRPRQCRSWPFWESNLKSERHWRQTVDICPGSGEGRLYTIDEIDEKKAMIRI
jgi:Fe-S-cluster containining protein